MHKNEHIKALKINYKNLIFGNCMCIRRKYWNGSEFVYDGMKSIKSMNFIFKKIEGTWSLCCCCQLDYYKFYTTVLLMCYMAIGL